MVYKQNKKKMNLNYLDRIKSKNCQEPATRFKDGIPEHSVDLTVSCPRCLAAAANKPDGSEGEFKIEKKL